METKSQAAIYYAAEARREDVRRVALLRAGRHADAEVALRKSSAFWRAAADYQRATDAFMAGRLDDSTYYAQQGRAHANAAQAVR